MATPSRRAADEFIELRRRTRRPSRSGPRRAEHRLVLPRCTNCGTFRFPPVAVLLRRAAHQEVEWIEHDGDGEIYSFTVMRHAVIPEVADALPIVIGGGRAARTRTACRLSATSSTATRRRARSACRSRSTGTTSTRARSRASDRAPDPRRRPRGRTRGRAPTRCASATATCASRGARPTRARTASPNALRAARRRARRPRAVARAELVPAPGAAARVLEARRDVLPRELAPESRRARVRDRRPRAARRRRPGAPKSATRSRPARDARRPRPRRALARGTTIDDGADSYEAFVAAGAADRSRARRHLRRRRCCSCTPPRSPGARTRRCCRRARCSRRALLMAPW